MGVLPLDVGTFFNTELNVRHGTIPSRNAQVLYSLSAAKKYHYVLQRQVPVLYKVCTVF